MKNILHKQYSFLIIFLTFIYVGCKEHNKTTESLAKSDLVLKKNINTKTFKNDTLSIKTDTNTYKLDSITITSNSKVTYKIIVLENKEKQLQDNAQHDNLPILIQKQNGTDSYTDYLKNDKLIFTLGGNCPADGFQRIVSKNNYFTIEQTYCKDFMFVQSFTTFKVNENNTVTLHRYGEDYTDRSNPDKVIKGISLTTKDFGNNISFENVTSDFLILLKNKN
ncbi:hypothetical protein [Chryseobacterium sp. M5A1_1a]